MVFNNFRRDIWLGKTLIKMIGKIIKLKATNTTLDYLFHERVRKNPNKLGLVMADTNESMTFKEIEELCHKIANIFYDAGYRKGDTVALLMENRIEYMPIWIGLSMIGVITSLINYNLRGESLKHCIDVCNCRSIIYSKEMCSSLKEIENDLTIQAYSFDKGADTLKSFHALYDLMESASTQPPPICEDLTEDDVLLYMYTSGTTGLPKAVKWRRMKNVMMTLVVPLYGLREDDILYSALPLYHANAMCLVSGFFMNGCTAVIKKKFSASQYIEDCCKYNVTVINYIGETCRYILSQPKSVFDELNNIRWAFGNGLRASIWSEFQDRFKIKMMMEFYGSTEGNINLCPNNFGRVGAIGFRSLLCPNRDLRLVKTNKDTGEILRGHDGLALEAEVGEPGQAVGIITKIWRFDGYTNQEATDKKIARDIISKGDSAFLTGDLLIRDKDGFYYFHDRIGDTFRWRGENVSTNEVEGLLSKVIQLTDVCVYGVEVPGVEGKAGMACICDPDRQTNITDLPASLDKLLPKYAQPVFLRLTSSIDVTGTFKFRKNTFRKEGFAPHACGEDDALYYFDSVEKKYMAIDVDVYQTIMDNAIRF